MNLDNILYKCFGKNMSKHRCNRRDKSYCNHKSKIFHSFRNILRSNPNHSCSLFLIHD